MWPTRARIGLRDVWYIKVNDWSHYPVVLRGQYSVARPVVYPRQSSVARRRVLQGQRRSIIGCTACGSSRSRSTICCWGTVSFCSFGLHGLRRCMSSGFLRSGRAVPSEWLSGSSMSRVGCTRELRGSCRVGSHDCPRWAFFPGVGWGGGGRRRMPLGFRTVLLGW